VKHGDYLQFYMDKRRNGYIIHKTLRNYVICMCGTIK